MAKRADDDKLSAEDRLIARYFAPLATHPGALGLPTMPLSSSRRRVAIWCSRPTPSSAACISFADDAARDVAQQGAAGQSVRSRRQGRQAARLPAVAGAAEGDRRRLARRISREGLRADAELFGCPLFGGDTDRTPGPITISIAMFGSVPEGTMVRRAGAKPGDRVFVSGTIGDAALGACAAQGRSTGSSSDAQREHLLARYLLPQPRNALAEAVRAHASAAMDVSDGLAGDFAKLCRASRVGGRDRGGARAAVRCGARPCSPPSRRCWRPCSPAATTTRSSAPCRRPRPTASAPRRKRPTCAVTEIGADRSGRGCPLPRTRRPGARLQARLVQPLLKSRQWTRGRARYNQAKRDWSRKRHARHDGKKNRSQMPSGDQSEFRRRCTSAIPTSAYLRARAPRNVPRFSFEYGDTGAGADVGIAHNWAAFDAIKIVPRYGVHPTLPPIDVELVRPRYAAPIGIAPMGGPSLVWPGADLLHGQGGAARARSLHARRRRRRHHRGGRQGRARRVLAAALSFLPERPRHRLRPDQARDRGRRQGAGAHPRRAGAHHALARNLCRLGPANSARPRA